ncbi:hypothetical protein L484_004197 [Morus notabilis]|uniref:Uncharacterized protein n=1 Tax=Morus notabilis TaxID=981085 RepID=W9R5J0_9ROSA|nr:hypothetical protein L484_004197 [Morus notabilis]
MLHHAGIVGLDLFDEVSEHEATIKQRRRWHCRFIDPPTELTGKAGLAGVEEDPFHVLEVSTQIKPILFADSTLTKNKNVENAV